MSYHSLSCCVIIFSVSSWLIQGSSISKKRGYNRVSWSFVFLRLHYLFYFCWNSLLVLMKNVASQDFQCLYCFSMLWNSPHGEIHQNFLLMDICKEWCSQEQWTHILWISSLVMYMFHCPMNFTYKTQVQR